MQIVTTFNNIRELRDFVKSMSVLAKETEAAPQATPQQTAPQHVACEKVVLPPSAQQTPIVPETPVAPVQQTPVAPTVPAPVAPQTPVAPTAPAPVAPQTPVTPSVPVGAHEYSLDEISVAAMQLMDAGRQAELQQLLAGFGVPSLPALPKAQYGAFATQLRAMGARI